MDLRALDTPLRHGAPSRRSNGRRRLSVALIVSGTIISLIVFNFVAFGEEKSEISAGMAAQTSRNGGLRTPLRTFMGKNANFIGKCGKDSGFNGKIARIASVNAKKGIATIPADYSHVIPSGDYVLAKFEEEEDFSEGVLWMPESLKPKPNLAEVVAVGSGRREDGTKVDFDVAPGDVVLYTRFGMTGLKELELEKTGDTYVLIKNDEIAAKVPSMDNYEFEDFQSLGNFILVKQDSISDETTGGILLTDDTKERPSTGQVVKVGPGSIIDGETRKIMDLTIGDCVMYNKYAGDELEDEDGTPYVVLKENDVICKLSK